MKKDHFFGLSVLSLLAMCFLLMTDKISRTLIWVGWTNTGKFAEAPEPISSNILIFAIILLAMFIASLIGFLRTK